VLNHGKGVKKMEAQQVIKLAISFLKELDGRYANDSCNDRFLEVNGDNMIMAQEIAERRGEDVSIVTYKNEDMISLFDTDLLNLCIDKLKELMPSKTDIKNTKIYILHWKDGKNQKVSGENIADAMTHAGYGAGAIPALDYYEEMKAQL
jgi:hypothetical protein